MRYGKISEAIWSDNRFQTLSDGSKLLYIYLLSCESCNSIGIFRIGYGTMEDEFGKDRPEIETGIKELVESGLIGYRDKWLWFNRFLRWNLPVNPNQSKQYAAFLNECVMKGAPIEAVWNYLGNAHAMLNQLRFQSKDGACKTFWDEFRQVLDKVTIVEFLGGEDNLMACISGKPYTQKGTLPKGSANTFKADQSETETFDKRLPNVTETLPEGLPNNGQRLALQKQNQKQKPTRNRPEQNVSGLVLGNDFNNNRITVTCKNGQTRAVSDAAMRIINLRFPDVDLQKLSERLSDMTEKDPIIRPAPDDRAVDSWFISTIEREYHRGGKS